LLLKECLEAGSCFGLVSAAHQGNSSQPAVGCTIGPTLAMNAGAATLEQTNVILRCSRRFRLRNAYVKDDSFGLRMGSVEYIEDQKEDAQLLDRLRNKLVYEFDLLQQRLQQMQQQQLQLPVGPLLALNKSVENISVADPASYSWKLTAALNTDATFKYSLLTSTSVSQRLQMLLMHLSEYSKRLGRSL